jgi:hypothetical protein
MTNTEDSRKLSKRRGVPRFGAGLGMKAVPFHTKYQIRAFGTEPNVCIRLKTEYLLRTELRWTHSYFHYQNTGRIFSAAGTWRSIASLVSSDPFGENRAQRAVSQFALYKPQLPNYVRFCSADCCVCQQNKYVQQKWTSVHTLLLLLHSHHSLQSLNMI